MKIAIFYRHFPVAMGRYIHWGLEQAGHKVISVGPWSKGTIPWGEFNYPKEYWFPPTVETPDVEILQMEDLFKTFKKAKIKPDMIIQAADTYFIHGKAPIPNILIGTDPHVIDYRPHLEHVDKYFSMQKSYGFSDSGWLPYGYDPEIHQWFPDLDKEWDVVMCGLQYEHRKAVLMKVSNEGYRVFSGLGKIYAEYVNLYNTGKIAFNWSSRDDLPARFWEGLAMHTCVVTNNVPDLKEFDFKDGVDYVGFETEDEAVDKIKMLLKKPELMEKIAKNGYKKVEKHTYKNRVIKMLKEI